VESNRNRTDSMRSKEKAHDYRYFPSRTCCQCTEPAWREEIRRVCRSCQKPSNSASSETMESKRTMRSADRFAGPGGLFEAVAKPAARPRARQLDANGTLAPSK